MNTAPEIKEICGDIQNLKHVPIFLFRQRLPSYDKILEIFTAYKIKKKTVLPSVANVIKIFTTVSYDFLS